MRKHHPHVARALRAFRHVRVELIIRGVPAASADDLAREAVEKAHDIVRFARDNARVFGIPRALVRLLPAERAAIRRALSADAILADLAEQREFAA